MAASHEVLFVISNATAITMKYISHTFDSGRLDESEQWPNQITPDGNPNKIICVDKNNALAGVSGSVTYAFRGVQITIGFSNPFWGTNKYSVVTGGHKDAINALDDYGYGSHTTELTIDEHVKIKVIGSVTKGDVNRLNLAFQSTQVW